MYRVNEFLTGLGRAMVVSGIIIWLFLLIRLAYRGRKRIYCFLLGHHPKTWQQEYEMMGVYYIETGRICTRCGKLMNLQHVPLGPNSYTS